MPQETLVEALRSLVFEMTADRDLAESISSSVGLEEDEIPELAHFIDGLLDKYVGV